MGEGGVGYCAGEGNVGRDPVTVDEAEGDKVVEGEECLQKQRGGPKSELFERLGIIDERFAGRFESCGKSEVSSSPKYGLDG